MKKLFLTSSVSFVASDIAQKIDQKKYKKLAFISTAAEVEAGDKAWLQNDKDALITSGFDVFEYSLTNKNVEQVRRDLQEADVLFFSGGNTFYLLEKIQQSNSAEFFQEQIEKGVMYIGSSAGSIVAGPNIEIVKHLDSIAQAPNLQGYEGLSLVDFVVMPHWGSNSFRELYLGSRMEQMYRKDYKVILLTDRQYVHVQDDWYRIEEI